MKTERRIPEGKQKGRLGTGLVNMEDGNRVSGGQKVHFSVVTQQKRQDFEKKKHHGYLNAYIV
jgi:hypothetical protein